MVAVGGRGHRAAGLLADADKVAGFDEVRRNGENDQRRLDYFREIHSLLARRHPFLAAPGVAYWNSERRQDVLDSNVSVTAQIARWNQQLAAAVAAVSSNTDVHPPPPSLMRHLRPPPSTDVIHSDNVIPDVNAHDV